MFIRPDTRPTSRRRFYGDPGGGFRGQPAIPGAGADPADLHDRLGGPSVPPAHGAQPRPPGRHAPSYEAGVAPALGSWRRRWPAPPPPPPSPIRLLPAGRPTTRPLPADGIVADATSPVARAAPPRCAQPRRLPVAGDPAAVPPILRTRSRDPTPLFSSSPQTPHLPAFGGSRPRGWPGVIFPPCGSSLGGRPAKRGRTATFTLQRLRRPCGVAGTAGEFGGRTVAPRSNPNSPPPEAARPFRRWSATGRRAGADTDRQDGLGRSVSRCARPTAYPAPRATRTATAPGTQPAMIMCAMHARARNASPSEPVLALGTNTGRF